jgi:glycosyltransferase involved in cell wall biosynthesis
MEENVLVSIIISVYNSERFIRRRIDNLVSQTIFDKSEIIVINSGSCENEETIILEYQKLHKNIKYFRTERETIYKAWNKGIKASCGKYITNANSDDLLRNDALEILSDYLETNPDAAVVYTDQFITSDAKSSFENINKIKVQKWNNYSYPRMLEASLCGPQPMWRASLHHQDQIWFKDDYLVAGDFEFFCHVGLKHKLKHLPVILGAYYLSPDESNKEYQDRTITFLETYKTKKEYSFKYFEELDEKEFYRLFRYLTRWANSPVLFYYFWKISMKLVNPDKRLPTKEFAIWFFVRILIYLGDKSKAINVINEYLRTNKSRLIEKQLLELNEFPNGNPLISVIIPTYNRPRFLSEALQSLVEQKEKLFEVIIVNNGTDDVSDIIQLYKEKLQINYLISDKIGSVSHAKNIGIENSKGDYIAFLDDDDWYHPDHLSTLKSELNKGLFQFVYADALVELQEEKDGQFRTVNKFVEYSKDFNRQLLLIKDYIFTPCIMLNKRCLHKVGLFDENLQTDEDMDLLIRISKYYILKHIKKVTCSVRRTNSQTTLTKNWSMMFKNARYLYKKHELLSKYNLFVKAGQFYYLRLRKSRALKSRNDSINNYY